MKHLLETPNTEIMGITVHEPGSIISNLVLVVICVICFFIIRKRGTDPVYRNWALFMLGMAISAFGGIITHGFPASMPIKALWALWAFKNAFINLGSYYGEVASMHGLPYEKKAWIKPVLIAKGVAAVILTSISQNFLPTIIDISTSYIFILTMSGMAAKKNIPGARQVLIAFSIMFLTGFLFLFKVIIDPVWFNHNDLAHAFITISFLIILSGTRNLQLSGTP